MKNITETYILKHPKKSEFGIMIQDEDEELFIFKKKFKTKLEAEAKLDVLCESTLNKDDWEPAQTIGN